jgi:hypothetical protein
LGLTVAASRWRAQRASGQREHVEFAAPVPRACALGGAACEPSCSITMPGEWSLQLILAMKYR